MQRNRRRFLRLSSLAAGSLAGCLLGSPEDGADNSSTEAPTATPTATPAVETADIDYGDWFAEIGRAHV